MKLFFFKLVNAIVITFILEKNLLKYVKIVLTQF